MRTVTKMVDYAGTMLDVPCETVMLDRLGSELALIYHDTMRSPLPDRLMELVERLDHEALDQRGGDEG